MTDPKPRTYAAKTAVPVIRTIGEIQALLEKHGATDFAFVSLDQGMRAAIAFRLENRTIRYAIPIPQPDEKRFTRTRTGYSRAPAEAKRLHDQAVRSRWRELLRLVDAKLIAIASGIVSLENEFLAWTVTASGQTVGEILGGQIDEMVAAGALPSVAGWMLADTPRELPPEQ